MNTGSIDVSERAATKGFVFIPKLRTWNKPDELPDIEITPISPSNAHVQVCERHPLWNKQPHEPKGYINYEGVRWAAVNSEASTLQVWCSRKVSSTSQKKSNFKVPHPRKNKHTKHPWNSRAELPPVFGCWLCTRDIYLMKKISEETWTQIIKLLGES